MKAIRNSTVLRSMIGLFSLSLAGTSSIVSAAETREPLGEQTQAWMELQKQQKPKPDAGISGEQATLIWERHIQSFGREIPDTLHDKGSMSSGGTR